MLILHITGVTGAGRSTLARSLAECGDLPRWDVDQACRDAGCYVRPGEMDWQRWREVHDAIREELIRWLETNQADGSPVVAIESSGINSDVAIALESVDAHVVEISLAPPPWPTVWQRERDKWANEVELSRYYRKWVERQGLGGLTYEEAVEVGREAMREAMG